MSERRITILVTEEELKELRVQAAKYLRAPQSHARYLILLGLRLREDVDNVLGRQPSGSEEEAFFRANYPLDIV